MGNPGNSRVVVGANGRRAFNQMPANDTRTGKTRLWLHSKEGVANSILADV